jgi:hypothetical protein
MKKLLFAAAFVALASCGEAETPRAGTILPEWTCEGVDGALGMVQVGQYQLKGESPSGNHFLSLGARSEVRFVETSTAADGSHEYAGDRVYLRIDATPDTSGAFMGQLSVDFDLVSSEEEEFGVACARE